MASIFLIDFFILHPSWNCTYISQKKWTDPRIGSRWLAAKPFGWRLNVTVVVNEILLGYIGTCLKMQTKHFYCYLVFLILLKQTMNIHKNGHHFQKSERTLNKQYCLAAILFPSPPPLPSCIPWFVVFHSCLGLCL